MSGRLTNIRPKPGFLMDGSGEIVPARRGNVIPFMRDGLANIMSGRGTSVDRRTHNAWHMITMPPQQAESAYRTNWLARKIVDIPAKDMTREGRAWQTDKANIEKLEAEEKRLQLWPKLLRCLILSRLFGGAALIPSTGDMDLDQPLAPDSVKAGGLRFVHVVNRWQLNIGPEITDPLSEWYGRPEWFEITGKNGTSREKLHPSRVFDFVGQRVPEGTQFTAGDSWYWGDSILQAIDETIKDATAAANGFAALTDEASLDIIKIPDLMTSVGTQEYEDRLMQRIALSKLGQSMHRAKLLDKEEEWEQRTMLWAGIPEIMMSFMELVAGAADIPVTRLLGQSPKGLQSTGKGEQQDYHDKVKADQDEILRPTLERFDELLIRSALGTRPSDIYFEFNSLEQPDETADAEIEKKVADTIKIYADTGLINEDVLGKMARNRIIEGGRWPGSEAAFEESDNEGLADPEDDPDAGKTQVELAAEKVEAMRMAGAVTGDQATLLMADAKPRSLYVQRKLLNAAEFLKWAKAQGFGETLSADDLHVTVLYSKTPVDWLKMGGTWDENEKGEVTVKPGGARIVEVLGDKGAVVLLFNSSTLTWRHEEMVRNGASHDFDDYQPHVAISWNAGDVDLANVEPYRGKLVFGPEIFAEIDEDWAPAMLANEGA
jgi:phage-related protein (TIGR01555 family)